MLPPLLRIPLAETSHGANPAAELILVFFLLLALWGVFRITSKRRP
jgi:hypothetical protein